MMTIDQLSRKIELKEALKRIVSLVPSQTELLCDLGLESSIVGITKFCVHPKHLISNITVVGGTKQVNFDKIKALKPDIILCNKEENTLEMVKALELIAPVHISDIYTIEDSLELTKMYGSLFLKEDKATELIYLINQKRKDFKNFIKAKPKFKTVYFIWKTPWMVAANKTFINQMLSVNNYENYFGNLQRYPEVELEVHKNVELVLLSSEPFPFKEEHIHQIQPFFPNAEIKIVDGEMFSWYGSRLITAFDYFKMLHQ